MPANKLKMISGKPKRAFTLWDDDLAGKRRLETAAQAFALDQRHGRERQLVTGVVAAANLDARHAIVDQSDAIAMLDQVSEEIEIASETEHASTTEAAPTTG